MNRIRTGMRVRLWIAKRLAGPNYAVWSNETVMGDLMMVIKAVDEARHLRVENRLLNEEIAAMDCYMDTLREKLGEEVNRYE